MSDRVPAFDRLGNPITVPVEQLPELQRMGGRAATGEEIAKARSDEAYAQKSTVEKATSLGSVLGPVPFAARAAVKLAQGKGAEIAPSLPPEMEAYAQGVSQGFAGGLPTAAMHEAVKVAGGAQAAKAYAQTVSDVTKAHPGYHTAGEVAGLAGAVAGPGVGTVGNVAQRGAAALIGETAGRGILTRALGTAAELGARGAAEGALLGGAQEITEESLGDKDLAADKIFAHMGMGALGGAAAGAVLGGLGSAGLSGAKKTGSALLRVIRPAEEVAAGRAEKAAELAEEAGAKAAATPEAGPLERIIGGNADSAVRGAAQEQAWKAVGGGFGLQSTKFAKKAQAFLPNGTRDVGEVLLRKGIINAEDGVVAAFKTGTVSDLLPRIEAEVATVGKRIGEMTDASGARVPAKVVLDAVDEVLAPLQKKAGHEAIVQGVQQYRDSLARQLGIGLPADVEKSLAQYPPQIRDRVIAEVLGKQSVSVQDLLAQRKALDELVWREGAPFNASPRVEELRGVRTKLEGAIVDALDEASGKMPGELADEYKALKKDFLALSLAKSAAEDSAVRATKGATLGLGEKMAIAGAIASGHIGAGPVLAAGGKLIRERGNAAAAVLLTKLADMGAVAKLVRETDAQITRASRGLLTKPKAIAGPASDDTPVRARAAAIIARVAAFQADPASHVDRVQRATEGLSHNAPGIAGAVQTRQIQALTLLASKIPVHPDPDPLDPHPAPPLTDAQAAELVRYERYIEKPMRFFEDLERGKITFEGAEVARELVPRAFEQLRMETLENLATLRAKGTLVPYNQRRQLGILIDAPTTPDQRPEHARFLQANVQPTPQDLAKIQGNAPSPPKRPAQMKTQQSALDRLAAK